MNLFKAHLMSFSAMLVSTSAVAISETEANHPIAAAQTVPIVSEFTEIKGALGNGGADDLDYYVFTGKAGEVVTLDIDGVSTMDTVMAVYGPGPVYKLLALNDDATQDEGSASYSDSRIDNFRLPQTGRYVVVVSNFPRYPMPGGTVMAGPAESGDYQLNISGVAPDIKQITIEVKPGSEGLAPLNPRSKGKIPVALMGSQDFDAMSVDPETLTFGSTGDEESFVKCAWTGTDLNGDGRVDRVCHFENQAAGFKIGDLEGVLRGRTVKGEAFEGHAVLKVVPQKASR